jgi:membrane protease YdiL (CAAX protease family)
VSGEKVQGSGFLRLGQLRTDWRAVTSVVVVVLLMTVEHYDYLRPVLGRQAYDRVFLYLVVPLVVIAIVFRRSPALYGFRIGDWRAGAVLTLGCCGALALTMVFLARIPSLQDYYGAERTEAQLPLALATAMDLIGWEFLFRGFLLFALYPVCGPLAIFIQAVPFTIAHFGKPAIETLSCIFGGSVLGYIAWRTRSFLYPFLIHWFLVVITVVIASGTVR